MKKIVILGPESTGKSTLALKLIEIFEGCLVKEYAREYLNNIKKEYAEEDLVEIAMGQIALETRVEKECRAKGKGIIFYDTDITVLKIWSEYKFGKCHPWIMQQYHQRSYDLYLLTYPDLAWVPDPLREHPGELHVIFELYLGDLKRRGLNYRIISDQNLKRTRQAIEAVQEIVS